MKPDQMRTFLTERGVDVSMLTDEQIMGAASGLVPSTIIDIRSDTTSLYRGGSQQRTKTHRGHESTLDHAIIALVDRMERNRMPQVDADHDCIVDRRIGVCTICGHKPHREATP